MATVRQLARGRRLPPLVLAALMVFVTSCMKYTQYPPGTWRDFDSSESERWRVKTPEEVFLVHRFATTDSALVIEELSKEDERYKLASRDSAMSTQDRSGATALELPITLSFDQVVSIERIDHDRVKETVLGVGLAAIAVVVVLAFESWLFSQAAWD